MLFFPPALSDRLLKPDPIASQSFARAHDCKRHELLHLGVRKYHCSPCKRDFVRLDALHRHRKCYLSRKIS